MMKNITSEAVISRLLNEGEWWYALALFSDKDLATLLQSMGIENAANQPRTKIVLALSQRLSESGKYIDMIRDYFNEHFLKPFEIPTHKSELWFSFGDCEALISHRLINSEYDINIDPQIHKDFVLDALTIEQLREVYNINNIADDDYKEKDRDWLIEQINQIDFVEEYDSFLRDSGELSHIKTEHGAMIEFLFGSAIVEEDEE
ncbi:hypothetical protein HOU08_gp272 [Dickeya phage vB_DsoM_JA29]|uniref:Uncharacterized protein n=1 Tax=Dickeya phage vB_DsoM_JA29 TaxID=2283031 RepID=A0A384ZXL6_9CAUD|nr:hypothetical protein HOU08_gp272 [Dickeya phage vB_DsoM_JA29]AXG66998.1 hypothetical protein JA29_272 [Dickeya phage vB_DsoM_JA29]